MVSVSKIYVFSKGLFQVQGGFQGVQRWTEERAGKTWNCHTWKFFSVDVSQFSGSFLLRLPAILGTKMPSDDERATCTSFDTILWVF